MDVSQAGEKYNASLIEMGIYGNEKDLVTSQGNRNLTNDTVKLKMTQLRG